MTAALRQKDGWGKIKRPPAEFPRAGLVFLMSGIYAANNALFQFRACFSIERHICRDKRIFLFCAVLKKDGTYAATIGIFT